MRGGGGERASERASEREREREREREIGPTRISHVAREVGVASVKECGGGGGGGGGEEGGWVGEGEEGGAGGGERGRDVVPLFVFMLLHGVAGGGAEAGSARRASAARTCDKEARVSGQSVEVCTRQIIYRLEFSPFSVHGVELLVCVSEQSVACAKSGLRSCGSVCMCMSGQGRRPQASSVSRYVAFVPHTWPLLHPGRTNATVTLE